MFVFEVSGKLQIEVSFLGFSPLQASPGIDVAFGGELSHCAFDLRFIEHAALNKLH